LSRTPTDGTNTTLNELVESVYICIEEAMKTFHALGHSTTDIETIGITNQRETVLVWDWETGEPLHNAITWTDTRTANLVRELKEKPGANELVNICGLPLSTNPSSVTLRWMLDHLPLLDQPTMTAGPHLVPLIPGSFIT
jgi:Glycerol kinase